MNKNNIIKNKSNKCINCQIFKSINIITEECIWCCRINKTVCKHCYYCTYFNKHCAYIIHKVEHDEFNQFLKMIDKLFGLNNQKFKINDIKLHNELIDLLNKKYNLEIEHIKFNNFNAKKLSENQILSIHEYTCSHWL